jgi:hypothetical protein
MGRRKAVSRPSLPAPQNRRGAPQARAGSAPMPSPSKPKAANRRFSPLAGNAAWERQITERD